MPKSNDPDCLPKMGRGPKRSMVEGGGLGARLLKDAEQAIALSTAVGGPHFRPGEETIFTSSRKLRFLDELARHGNVRVAAARCGVSRSGAYLARQRDLTFADAWRAALVLGRDRAAEDVAERAINGWEEPVFYRGRQAAVRRRHDARLLLAHLARLDKVCADGAGGVEGAEALAARYDELRGAL